MPGSDTFRASADAYDRLVGRYGASLGAALADFARVEAGRHALDVGCGTGALAAVLAERLGGENVTGAEPSEAFAEACRARLPDVHVAVAPAEALPFPDGSFDATLAQLVLNFLDDAAAGVREMARVTRPGGVVAACVWDYAGEMTLLRAFWDAALEVDPERGARADEGAVMHPRTEAELALLWRGAGLDDVATDALESSAAYEGFEDLWAPFTAGVAPSGAFVAALGPTRRGALRDAFRRRLGVGDGPFELTARAWAVRGVVQT